MLSCRACFSMLFPRPAPILSSPSILIPIPDKPNKLPLLDILTLTCFPMYLSFIIQTVYLMNLKVFASCQVFFLEVIIIENRWCSALIFCIVSGSCVYDHIYLWCSDEARIWTEVFWLLITAFIQQAAFLVGMADLMLFWSNDIVILKTLVEKR